MMVILSVTWWRLFWASPDEGYSRNALCALNLISTFYYSWVRVSQSLVLSLVFYRSLFVLFCFFIVLSVFRVISSPFLFDIVKLISSLPNQIRRFIVFYSVFVHISLFSLFISNPPPVPNCSETIHHYVCSSSIYGFWYSLWYLQTLLIIRPSTFYCACIIYFCMWITQVSMLWFQRWGGEVSHKFISINSHNTTFSKLINHFQIPTPTPFLFSL
jgi:hypothetical protein